MLVLKNTSHGDDASTIAIIILVSFNIGLVYQDAHQKIAVSQ